MVLLASFISIPRFFQTELNYNNTRNGNFGEIPMFKPTELMKDKNFRIYYTYGTLFFATVFIPVISLLFLNIRIIYSLITSSRGVTR